MSNTKIEDDIFKLACDTSDGNTSAIDAAHKIRQLIEDLEIAHSREIEDCITDTRKDLLQSLRERMPEKRVTKYHGVLLLTDKGFNEALDQFTNLLNKMEGL